MSRCTAGCQTNYNVCRNIALTGCGLCAAARKSARGLARIVRDRGGFATLGRL